MRYNKLLISVLAATCLISASANANVGTGMQQMFDSMGGYSNATPPSSYKGQTMNGYSAGGFYARVPVRTFQIAQMTPPAMNIGCGGIDLTAGAFSFINKSTITALFQNIGTSLSYAFMLAIQSSMPEMANLFKYLQDVANKVNSSQVNTCKMAEGIPFVKGAALSDNLSTMFSHIGGTTTNMFRDAFESLSKIKDSAVDQKNVLAATVAADPTKKDQIQPGNVVWRALSKSTGLDNEDKLLIMSLTGTIIILPPDGTTNPLNGGTKATWVDKPPTGIKLEDFIGYNEGPTQPIQMYTCDTSTECMNPSVPATGGVIISPFLEKVTTKLHALQNNLIGRGQQTISDFKLVDVSSLPVWKLISVSSSYNPGLLKSYEKLIAVDVAYEYMNSVIIEAARIMANSQNGSVPNDAQEALQRLTDRLTKLSQALQTQRLAEYAKVQQEAQLERQIQLLQQTMIAGIPSQAFNSMVTYGEVR